MSIYNTLDIAYSFLDQHEQLTATATKQGILHEPEVKDAIQNDHSDD